MIRSILPLLAPLALAVSVPIPTAPAGPKQDVGTDIYGRPLPRPTGEVDAFGRPILRPGDIADLGVDIYGRPLARDGENPYLQLQGCWQLFEFDHPELPVDDLTAVGNMLITDHFLALEFHVEFPSEPDFFGELFELVFQSGIHEYQIDQLGQLRTSSLIGAAVSPDRELLWQPGGDVREYRIEFRDNTLTLTNDQDARFSFIRVRPSLVEPGFFGNTDDRDLFGRKIRVPSSAPEDGSTETDD